MRVTVAKRIVNDPWPGLRGTHCLVEMGSRGVLQRTSVGTGLTEALLGIQNSTESLKRRKCIREILQRGSIFLGEVILWKF